MNKLFIIKIAFFCKSKSKIDTELIRQIRMQKGFSQEYVAHFLKISQSKYSRLENGSTIFDVPTLGELVKCLDIDPFTIIILSDELKELVKING